MIPKLAAAAMVVCAMTVSGCGSGESLTRPPSIEVGDASWAVSYASLQDLADDSQMVVIAQSTGKTRIEMFGRNPYQISTMTVVKSLLGEAPDTIEVRLGVSGKDDPLGANGQYLLFLKPFWVGPGVSDGTWNLAGTPLGAWWSSTDDNFVPLASGDTPALETFPKVATLTDVSRLKVSTFAELADKVKAPGTGSS